MYSRKPLREAVKPGQHQCFYKMGSQVTAAAGAMTADKIILKLEHIFLTHLVLSHRTKACIDAVNQLLIGKMLEELKN